MVGIEAYAVEVPRLRVSAEEYRRAFGRCAARIESKRVPDHDEDEVTLAIAAARRCLALAGTPRPTRVLTASATAALPPDVLEAALDLGEPVWVRHDGPGAGLAALASATADEDPAVLVVSADAPSYAPGDEREHGAGAAATAWLLTARGAVQVRRRASAPSAAEALRRLTRTGLAPDAVARAATNDLDAASVAALQRALPKARLAPALGRVGEVGGTGPLLGLAAALEEGPGETLVALASAPGQATALSFEPERRPACFSLQQALAAPAEDLPYESLARLRGWRSPARPDVSQGAAVSAAQYAEHLRARLRLEAQRCEACGKVLFPPREACQHCGGAVLGPVKLAGRGTVHSATTIGRGGAPSEFLEQQRRAGAYDVVVVELPEGPRVAAQVTGAPPGSLRIGATVEFAVRRLYAQDGAVRYGFKVRPAPA